MSALEDVRAQTEACLSDIGETASAITGVKDVVEEHTQLSIGVGSQSQIAGGQSLADGLSEVMTMVAEGMNDVEGVALEAQLLET